MSENHKDDCPICQSKEPKGFYTCPLCRETLPKGIGCKPCTDDFDNRIPAELLTTEEKIAELMQYLGPLSIPFELLHKRIEELLGRSVWTHEMANPDLLAEEIERGRKAEMDEILAKVPKEKRLIVNLPDAR